MTGRSRRETLLQDFLDRVWSGGEIAACDSFVAPVYVIRHDPGDPWDGQSLDIAGFRDRVSRSRAAFPDQRFDVQASFTNDDGVVVTWLWEGTHAGDLPGFPATGARIAMSGATAYFFDAQDRICGHWQVADRLGVYRQLQEARAVRGGS